MKSWRRTVEEMKDVGKAWNEIMEKTSREKTKDVGKAWNEIMEKNSREDERRGQDLERNQLAC